MSEATQDEPFVDHDQGRRKEWRAALDAAIATWSLGGPYAESAVIPLLMLADQETASAIEGQRAGALRALLIERERRRRSEQFVADLREATVPTAERLNRYALMVVEAEDTETGILAMLTDIRSQP